MGIGEMLHYQQQENPKQACGSTKPQLHLIPPVAEIAEANVLEYGAFKAPRTDGTKGYGPWNWRDDPIKVCTYISAVRRHLNAIMRGEDIDPTSGESHWAHIRANCGIVMDAMACGSFIDDRPSAPQRTRNYGDQTSRLITRDQLEVHEISQTDPDDLAPIASRMPVRDEEDETPTDLNIDAPIPGPCTYCGDPNHWRPDCPKLGADIKAGWMSRSAILGEKEACPHCHTTTHSPAAPCPLSPMTAAIKHAYAAKERAANWCDHCKSSDHSQSAPCPLKLKEQLQLSDQPESTHRVSTR